ncbi:hypothetical protein Tco_0364698 [Tanacetum coccineum]
MNLWRLPVQPSYISSRFWFVQEIAEEEGLLKFLRDRCDDLRRKNARRRVLIREMEALGERGVAVDSLESLKQTHARETAKLAALTLFVLLMVERAQWYLSAISSGGTNSLLTASVVDAASHHF